MSKPTILLVPGAWQPSDAFGPLRHLLQQKGYESVAVDHPSVGGEPANQTLDTDVASLRAALTNLVEEQAKHVVLVLHSYGTSGLTNTCPSHSPPLSRRSRRILR